MRLFLSDDDLAKRYGVTRQSIWRWAREREAFPNPIKLTPGCSRWRLSDIEAYEAAATEAAQ